MKENKIPYLVENEDRDTFTFYIKGTKPYLELQQENKQLKERYEILKKEHIDTITRNEEKQQRIDKAIEYIKEHNIIGVNKEYLPSGIERCCSVELLEILGDKE